MRAGFRLAGVEIELRVPEGAIEQIIARRWSSFLGASEAPVCSLSLRPLTSASGKGFSDPIEVERPDVDHVTLRHRHLRAEIDLGGHGEVDVAATPEALDFVLELVFSLLTPRTGAVLMEASGVISGGRAHLFVDAAGGPVPAAVERVESRAVLSAQVVVLYRREGRWWAGSTPFGAAGDGWPARAAALDGVWTWTAASQLAVSPLERLGSLRAVMDNAVRPCRDGDLWAALFDLAADVAASVPSASITVPPDGDAWDEIDAVGRALQFRRALAGLKEPGMRSYAAGLAAPQLSARPPRGR
ncbi:MAG: hypothetical protein QOG43_2511 [Actinomycetota bacterium]|jgi:hypothetical protein|nr:hypothetical protein [Actinomycetota bacterium]